MEANTKALQVLQLGQLETNCYILQGNVPNSAIVVDPAAEADRIEQALDEIAAQQIAVLLTHGHYDHIGACERLQKDRGAVVYILEEEQELMQDASMNCSSGFSNGAVTARPDRLLKDGQKLELAGHTVEVIATPGHTAGGACYYFPLLDILFSGDTLFAGTAGRSDLPTGDMMQLLRSLRSKLSSIPDQTFVCPGHGPSTNMERERRSNPFIREA